MAKLFDIRDESDARKGWSSWSEGMKANGISALVRFAQLKENRLLI